MVDQSYVLNLRERGGEEKRWREVERERGREGEGEREREGERAFINMLIVTLSQEC